VFEKHHGMAEVNRQLGRYRRLHEMFDAWLVIAVEDDVVETTSVDNGKGEVEEKNGQCAQTQPNETSNNADTAAFKATDGATVTATGTGTGTGTGTDTGAAAGIDAVYQWRLQAETAMRAAGRAGLSDPQVADFIARFMPAYETYLPALYAQGPQRRDGAVPVLKVGGIMGICYGIWRWIEFLHVRKWLSISCSCLTITCHSLLLEPLLVSPAVTNVG
jgi:hypothetical protein